MTAMIFSSLQKSFSCIKSSRIGCTGSTYLRLYCDQRLPATTLYCTTAFAPRPPASYLQSVTIKEKSIKNPKEYIELKLSIVDTHPGKAGHGLPTIVGVHGIPGSGMDFDPLIRMLSDKGIRFVAPTFPGFEPSLVEPWKLYHLDYSTDGLAGMLKSIITEINVDKINMLMCHSAGAWVGYKVAAEWENVQSFCLLSGAVARPHKTLRPFAVVKFIAWLAQQQVLHFFLLPLLAQLYNVIGFSGIKAGEHLMVAQQIVTSQDFKNMPDYAAKIRDRKLPLIFAYALNDKIIEQSITDEMITQHLRMPTQNKIYYCENRLPSKDPFLVSSDGQIARVLQFERGGHVVHKAHASIIMDHILDVLNQQGIKVK